MSLGSSQCLIITAPSGAGKSTLHIKALMRKYQDCLSFQLVPPLAFLAKAKLTA